MVIAVITLMFYIISDKKAYHFHHDTTLKELTIVSEMSLTIGLFTLTVGNFLGGIWANESWGRYWSWDPKETWAFIVWLNYAVWLHLRLVAGWRGKVLAWWAIIGLFITAFAFLGVNMFLSGLHSYGTL